MNLIPAILKDEEFLLEVETHRSDGDNLHLWWLGQSGFLLQWKGLGILMDPYLSDSLTRKYAHTEKPHIRMSERVVAPEALTGIHIITSSHNHTDHLDAETLIPVLDNNPDAVLVIPEANRPFVADRLKIDPSRPVGMTDGDSIPVDGIYISAVPAAHNDIERDEQGRCRFLGYVLAIGPWRIYHSGDTLLYPGMGDLLRPFAVHLALLPINGNDAARGVAGNLDGKEAARLAKDINAGVVIPCHYDMFTFNTASPDEFAQEAQSIEQPMAILGHGQRYSLLGAKD